MQQVRRVGHEPIKRVRHEPVKRVRHDVADGLALMAFSLTTSVVVAVALSILAGVA